MIRSGVIALILLAHSLAAAAFSKAERQELLDVLRPEVSRLAGQPVRFVVDTLNWTTFNNKDNLRNLPFALSVAHQHRLS